MELEEIVSRLEHLDGERRKAKTAMGGLERRLSILEGTISGVHSEVKGISDQVQQLQILNDRLSQIDTGLSKIRTDFKRSIDKVEKQSIAREKDLEKIRLTDMESINKQFTEQKKYLAFIKEFRKELKENYEEEVHQANRIEELQAGLSTALQQNDETGQQLKILDDAQRMDMKRISDIQGETAAVRKRIEEQRGKLDFLSESIQKLDERFSENLASEADRKQALLSLVERENLKQVERDHAWQEWLTQFEDILQESKTLETKLASLDIMLTELKRSQASFDDINQRFDRKINEMIEMQRLTDERFRQEWTNFKAEDQKRWTNYSLIQKDMMHDTNHEVEIASDRISKLEEISLEIREVMTTLGDETQKRLQVLLELTNDWMDSNQRTLNKGK